MISLEDWALIRRLHRSDGLSQRAIAKQLGIARATVAGALAAAGPPRYERVAVTSSAWLQVEQSVRGLLAETPTMPASVIAERIGWTGSMSWLRENVSRLRPAYAPADPADRLVWLPGDAVQCDLWFPPVKVPTGAGQHGSPPVLVMVASYSRFITAVMLPSRTTPDLVAGMWLLLRDQLGAVPRRLVWDNEAGIGRRGSLTGEVTSLIGVLGCRLVQCKPYDPETKGIVERANQYLETSFLPGRTFSGPADFNSQLVAWLPAANRRLVRRVDAQPAQLIEGDRAAMLSLPPVPPVTGWRQQVRLGRDYYVRVASNDYSVDPTAIGTMVEVTASLDQVIVTRGGQVLARHPRCWATRQVITDSDHVDTAARLRAAYQQPRPVPDPRDDLVRDLSCYDTAFGVTIDGIAS